ncbi:MAG: hypothetical protein HG439_002405 [candidate division SR1 bacterium]|nr:hypothetical protein [candidate division SR1 bacterium]
MEPTKGLNPLLPDGGRKDVKYLILGTFPGQATLDANQDRGNPDEPIYYCNLSNRFWKVIQNVFGGDSRETFNQLNQAIGSKDWESVYKLQKEICTKYGIALRDRVAECYLLRSSKDTERLPKKYHNFYEYIMKPNKDGKHIVVLLNGMKLGLDFRLYESEYQEQRELFFRIWNESNGITELNTVGLNTKKLQSWMNFLNLCPISINPVPSTSGRSSNDEIVNNWKKNLK